MTYTRTTTETPPPSGGGRVGADGGMLMPGRSFSSDKYRFGFNGKENDNEIKGTGNQQDYGMRIYDPRIIRFNSVDPIAGKFPMLTPYQFASNSFIMAVDLDGLEMKISIYGTGQGPGEEQQFRTESANDVANKVTTASEPVFKTTKFLNYLEQQSKNGGIQLLTLYSHSNNFALFLDNGGYSRQAVMQNGFMYPKYKENAINLNNIINDKGITFNKGSLVVFGGCNTACPVKLDYVNGVPIRTNEPVTPFAEQFTKLTGVSSIGADGETSPQGPDQVRTADYGYFLFQMTDAGIVKTALGKQLTGELIQRVADRLNPPERIQPRPAGQISTSGTSSN